MKKCPFCGNEINDNMVICVNCGRALKSPPDVTVKKSAIDLDLILIGLMLYASMSVVKFVLSSILMPILYEVLYIDDYYGVYSVINVISDILTFGGLGGLVMIIVGYLKRKKEPKS